MKSHRVAWPEKGMAVVEEFEVPTPAEDEVVIQTRVSLISPGTERAFFLGLPNAAAQFPIYPGYSNVGEIIQLGARAAELATDLKIGARVVSHAPHASHAIADISDCILVPDEVADEDATTTSLAAIAMQGVRKARIELGESVVVIGAGIVGLLAVQLARLNGALPVACVDKDEQRLQFAREIGADAVMVADEDLQEQIKSACGEDGPRVVIEASGSPQAIATAFQIAGRFGRVIILGSTRGEVPPLDFYRDVHYKGLTIIGAHNSSRPREEKRPGWWPRIEDQKAVLQFLAAKRLNIQPLISHRFHWREAAEAYKRLTEGDASTQAMLLQWRDD